jgi:hypothetical protein
MLLNLQGEKLLPGTVTLEGSIEVIETGGGHVGPLTRLYYDPLVGAHGILRDLTTEFQMMGITEQFQNYPRLVKMNRLALTHDESLGTETSNCLELTVHNEQQAKGILEGLNSLDGGGVQTDGGGYAIPFSLKLMNALNSASAPVSSSSTGQVRLRIRLAPANEFLYGEDFTTGGWTYIVRDLRLRYQTIPDDGKKQQVQMQVYHSYRTLLDSNNTNISTFVPGLAMAVQASFINQNYENDPNQNFLTCQPPPGIPPVGASDIADGSSTIEHFDYGIERLYYAINDTDTALVGFTLESREEILINALRAFGGNMQKFGALLRRMRNPDLKRTDGYLAGIPFGGLLDFSRNKFAAQIETQCDSFDNLFGAYFFFPMVFTLTA